MTPKQQRFVEEYLIDLNATQAAIRAGYSPRSARNIASENMAKPDIQEAIAEAKRERSEATGIDAQWVLHQLTEVYRRCIQEVRPALHPKSRRQLKNDAGEPLFTFNANAALRALEAIGKHTSVGAFEERVSVDHNLVDRIRAAQRRVAGVPIDADYTELPAP